MWIIFFNGTPSFWLVGDTTYHAGKRDCDVNIEDDKSVSRNHLTFSVGLTPAQHVDRDAADETERELSPLTPAPLVLTDTSTYGTTVYPCGKATDKDEDKADDAAGVARSTSTLLASDVGLGSDLARSSRGSAQAVPSTATSVWPAVGAAQRLTKNAPFAIPHDDPRWRAFTAVLGNHGAALLFVWVPVQVLVEDVEAEWHTKLAHAVRQCGAFIVHETEAEAESASASAVASASSRLEASAARRLALYQGVDLLVSTAVQPSAAVVALLCRGVPLVTPAFFLDVRGRASAQAPLPDVQRYTPPLAGTFWERLMHEAQPGDALDEGSGSQTTRTATALMLPHPRRQRLLDGLTLVVFQATLYEEVAQYVACAGGCLVLDQTLANAVSARTTETTVAAFCARHGQHVVLYSQTERMPFRGCLEVLRDQQALVCLEYAALITALFLVRPLTLAPFPAAHKLAPSHTDRPAAPKDDPAATCGAVPSARPSGRRTDAQPLFPELYGSHSTTGRTHSDALGEGGERRRDPHRRVDAQGWVSRGPTVGGHDAPPARHDARKRPRQDDAAPGEAEDEMPLAASRRRLPPYPCFCPYADATTGTTSQTAYLTVGGKAFRKQALPAPAPLAELTEAPAGALAAQLLTSRVPAVDSDDLIADRGSATRAVPRASANASAMAGFNAFDTAALNSVNRKKGTTRRNAKAPRGHTDGPMVTEAHMTRAPARQPRSPPPASPPPPPAPAPAPPARSEAAFNVFDIEGIF